MERNIYTNKRKSRPGTGIIWVLLLVVGILMGSCMKRKLDTPPEPIPETGIMHLTVNWPQDDVCPTEARCLIYHEEGGLYKEVNHVTRELQETLLPGKYRLIVHNSDALQVEYRGMDNYHTAEIFATQDPNNQGNTPCLMGPQMVFAKAAADQGEIFEVTIGQTTRISVTPPRATRRVRLYFTVTGLEAITSLKGLLQGVSPGMTLSTQTCYPTSCNQPYTGAPYTPESKKRTKTNDTPELLHYMTQVEVFDLLTREGSPEATNVLTMDITDDKSHTYSLNQDVTSSLQQIINDNGGNFAIDIALDVELTVDPVSLEMSAVVTPWDKSGSGGGAFE